MRPSSLPPQAQADVVVAVAAAVNRLSSERPLEAGRLHSEEWARAFELDRCLWWVDAGEGVGDGIMLGLVVVNGGP
jgi:hypothetical protein